MKKYKVKEPKHYLLIIEHYGKSEHKKYEIITNKSRFYEGTTISFIRG